MKDAQLPTFEKSTPGVDFIKEEAGRNAISQTFEKSRTVTYLGPGPGPGPSLTWDWDRGWPVSLVRLHQVNTFVYGLPIFLHNLSLLSKFAKISLLQ
jgi:hypothetical protein